MTQLNAFVGHSFTTDDHSVVEAFLKYFNQVKGMDIGFAWESAEPAEPKDLADKVMSLIKDKNLFIGICTRNEAAIEMAHLSKGWLNRKILNGPEDRFSLKTSDWIIQEIGLAIGRGMDLILLVESGLRRPGGLQGNLEYIQFERGAPKSFGKLLEMIQALRPKAKPVPVSETETRAVSQELPASEEKKGLAWLEPKHDWTREQYESAVFHTIAVGDTEGERRITEAFFASEEGQIAANRQRWEARGEHIRLVFGKGGKLSRLEELAERYRDSSDAQRYLALGYQHYSEHDKAGQCFIVAAERTDDKKVKLARYDDASLAFVRAGRKGRAQEAVKQMKLLAPKMYGGEIILINNLGKAAEIEKEKDLFFGATERVLQLHPDEVESRFSLAYNYSQVNQSELSLYHYLKIPYEQRQSITWNNLGVQFDLSHLPNKSVKAYRKAEELGETLAMSNLAQKLIKSGFLNEAEEICDRAIKIDDYHQNVGHAIARIKAIPDEERRKEKEALDKARPVSEFYRDYGRAAAQNEIAEHVGRWQGPDCELQITIKGDMFIGVGIYEVTRSGLGLHEALLGMPLPPPATDQYRVSYNGKIHGHAVESNVSREEITKSSRFPTSLLTEMANRKKAIMIVSETLTEIRVGEKDSSNKFSFYILTRLD